MGMAGEAGRFTRDLKRAHSAVGIKHPESLGGEGPTWEAWLKTGAHKDTREVEQLREEREVGLAAATAEKPGTDRLGGSRAVGVWGGRGPPDGLRRTLGPTAGEFWGPLEARSPARGGTCCTEYSLLPETAAASLSAPGLDPVPPAPPFCRRLYASDPSAPSPAGTDLSSNHVRSRSGRRRATATARADPAGGGG